MITRARSPLSRRAFLATGGLATAALVTGCGAVDDLLSDDGDASPAEETASVDEQLVSAALDDQERLLAICLAVQAGHKPVRRALAPLVEHHREHVRILGGDPSNDRARSGVSTSTRKSLTMLRRHEGDAAKQRAREAQQAKSGELARVLAAIAASQRQHEYVLDDTIGVL